MIKDLFTRKATNLIQIGRTGYPGNDVELDGNSVSRKHCTVEKLSDGNYKITDLDSKNGTFINGQLLKNESKIINQNDTIVIGKHVFTIQGNTPSITALSFENLEKTFPDGKTGFHSLNLTVSKGDFVAIMGPSGCGKSTLLKAIAGINPASLGRIKIDGVDLYKNYHLLKAQIGYVPQDDVLHKDLTVLQSLRYSMKLWSKEKVADEEISSRIKKVLQNVNITDASIFEKRISDLSGGQRKRIAIATELLFEPKLLLLDEPTSPLDPESVSEFLNCLKKLAKSGITVLMVTHKPEDLFHASKVLFMGTGGFTCYYGNTNGFLPYFNNRIITDVYALLKEEATAASYYKKFNEQYQSTSILKKVKGISSERKPDSLSQLYWLTGRYFKCKTANAGFLLFMFGQAPLISLLLTLIFNSVTIGVLFMMVITAIWFGVSNAAREIADELSIYKRERMYNLEIVPYVLSKVIVLSFLTFVQIAFFTLICYAAIGSEELSLQNYPQALFIIGLISVSSILLGLFLSAIVKSGEQAIAFMPLLLIPQVILAGIIHPIQSKLVDALSCFTFSRWGTEALSKIQADVMVQNAATGVKQKMDALKVLSLPDTFQLSESILLQDVMVLLFLNAVLFFGIVRVLREKDAL